MRIDGVTKGKPAYKGGMLKGDIITAIEGKKVGNIYEYMNRLKTLEAGQTTTLTFGNLAAEGDALVAQNDDTSQAGSYRVTVG